MAAQNVGYVKSVLKRAVIRGFVPDPGVDSASDNMFSPELSPCGVDSKDIEIGA